MLVRKLRKAVVGVAMGVMVLSTTVTPALPSTAVTVQAANKIYKPNIIMKNPSITAGKGSFAYLRSFVNIGAGTYRLKNIKVTSSNTGVVKVTNNSDWASIKFDYKKAGSSNITVALTDIKGNKTTKTIKMKVNSTSPLVSRVKGLKDVTIKRGQRVPNLSKGVSFERKYIENVTAPSMSYVNTSKAGTYSIKYYVMGKNGERLYITKKLIVR